MNKRELVMKVMDGGIGERTPIGFWWHFLPDAKSHVAGYQDPATVDRVVEGNKKMFAEFDPDMVKIMSDGFFVHPSIVENDVHTPDALDKITHITKDHPWVQKQIELINRVYDLTDGETLVVYNMFSAVQQLRLYTEYALADLASYKELMINNTEKTLKALKVVEEDTNMLLEEIKKHTKIDGIYYSVQMLQHPEATEEFHQKWIVPSDLVTMNKINSLWDYNILHICGYEHYHNKVEFFKQYPCKCYNWATHTDKISMSEGKKIFNASVCGGFDNNAGTLIDSGNLDDLKDYTKNLIKEAGRAGLIIGADCTIPGNTDKRRLDVIRNAAK